MLKLLSLAALFAVVVCDRFGVRESITFNRDSANGGGAAGAITQGHWTVWLDRDWPSGTGEYEDIERQIFEDNRRDECKMTCLGPISMELRLSQKHYYFNTSSLTEVMSCVVAEYGQANEYGFKCSTAAQRGMNHSEHCTPEFCTLNGLDPDCSWCPDVEVRFFCPMPKPKNPCQKHDENEVGDNGGPRHMKRNVLDDSINSIKIKTRNVMDAFLNNVIKRHE